MSLRQGLRGSLLIITLWLVTILGALSVAVARYLSTEVRLTRYRLARHEARELARSGVYLAMSLIQQDPPEVDWSGEPWVVPQTVSPAPGRRLIVTLTDEERKLNVNTATSAQLASLLGEEALAQAIVDYVDAPDPTEDRLDDPPYYAKNGLITVLEELSDIPDMDVSTYEALMSTTTPFTAPAGPGPGGPLNINTAIRQAMLALGLSEYTVDMIDGVRTGPNGRFEQPGDILPTLLGLGWTIADAEQSLKEQALLNAMTTSSSVFTVVAEGVVEQPPVRFRIQAVIQRSAGSPAPQIIAWKEGMF